MKRVLAGAVLLMLAACADNPTQPTITSKPQFATVPGTGATWYYEGHVWQNYGSSVNEGAIIKGTVTFQITGDNYSPDPCLPRWMANVTFKYTVDGAPFTISHSGEVMTMRSCLPYMETRALYQINANQYGPPWLDAAWFEISAPLDANDFPLVPPPLNGASHWLQIWDYPTDTGFQVWLDVLRVNDPQTKAECYKDGWKKFGFKNQGMCVSFIETGKDTR